MKRRDFMTNAVGMTAVAALGTSARAAGREELPNILWLTCEDMSPNLGCYGDDYADSPNIDAFAGRSLLYKHATSNAPVCAPARSTLISGVCPPSLGSQHMRSESRLPDFMRMYPCYLRDAGYYCTNNSKKDYNLVETEQVWDESSGKAHYKNRKPGQPFFAIFNDTVTHESKIRRRPHTLVHDPAKVYVPAYHPDTPEVRHDWTQDYDNIETMDATFGERIQELENAGLADNTIVFFYSDHGSGMPRSKRWPFNSGLHVPMIIHIPEKFRHLAPADYRPGGKTERLVSFLDLAPTLLSLAAIKPPKYMQGYAFLGKYEANPQPYLYGFRGRMDERYDMVRSIRDTRYMYLRQYMPHRIYGQYIQYMFQTPTTAVWRKMFDEGKLNEAQSRFWQPKPPEELYDFINDPDEVNNLVDSPDHQDVLKRMRKAQQDWARRIRDVGFLPEGEIHSRCTGDTPYEMGHEPKRYDFETIMAAAELAANRDAEALPALKKNLRHADSAVRYWGAMGLLIRGETQMEHSRKALHRALEDDSNYVRAIAAEALGTYGNKADLDAALAAVAGIIDNDTVGFETLLALAALDALGKKASRLRPAVEQVQGRAKSYTGARMSGYIGNVCKHFLAIA